jgi:hypothetical protein
MTLSVFVNQKEQSVTLAGFNGRTKRFFQLVGDDNLLFLHRFMVSGAKIQLKIDKRVRKPNKL